MNSSLKYSLAGLGVAVLFCGAFVGFARMRGAQMSELPLIGKLFPAAADPDAEGEHGDGESSHEPSDATSTGEEMGSEHSTTAAAEEPAPRPARASLLDAFEIQSPYDAEELQELVAALKASHREAETRLAAIVAREQSVAAREEGLREKEQELADLAARLEAQEKTLGSNKDQSQRATLDRAELDEQMWRQKSALFASGEVEVLAPRLVGSYPPMEAARILAGLPPDRAQELLDAVPEAKWREYAEAYATVAAMRTSPQPKRE